MILKDSLYTIIGKDSILESKDISFCIQINPQHFIYAAHFPGEPITPGVCILQIAQELLAIEIGEELLLKRIKNVKFTAAVSPMQLLQIWITFTMITIVEQEVSCQCTIVSSEPKLVCAKLSFTSIKNG